MWGEKQYIQQVFTNVYIMPSKSPCSHGVYVVVVEDKGTHFTSITEPQLQKNNFSPKLFLREKESFLVPYKVFQLKSVFATILNYIINILKRHKLELTSITTGFECFLDVY